MNRSDRIQKAIRALKGSMEKCDICPRRCGANRAAGGLGYCRAPAKAVVYSYLSHHGEEPALSGPPCLSARPPDLRSNRIGDRAGGRKGSGTIFFTHCNMKCVYCQNYTFSQMDKGEAIPDDRLASIMLHLQDAGCHNINLVSPTHFVPQMLGGLDIAVKKGLNIPIVYNTGGYDSVQTLELLDGIVDIYLPDMRYSSAEKAKAYSDAADYVKFNRAAIKEMHRQVGDLAIDSKGVAGRGLIIRLLVLPNDISGTAGSLKFIKDSISEKTYLSIMSQYYPTFKASAFSELSRPTNEAEYKNIVDEARRLGLNNGWVQEMPEDSDRRFLGTTIKPETRRKD